MRFIALLTAFFIGILFPQIHRLDILLPYLIIFMLFSVLLRLQPGKESLRPSHFRLAAANILLPLLLWLLLRQTPLDPRLALAAYLIAVTPPGTASPLIVTLLGGNPTYAVTAFLLSNLTVTLTLPLILPHILGAPTPGLTLHILQRLLFITLIPLLLALLLRRPRLLGPHRAETLGSRLGTISFYVWVSVVTIIAAKATRFIQETHTSPLIIAQYALLSLLISLLSFTLGRLLSPRRHPLEASQLLGHKNTSYTIYLALTYADPITALGPTLYVLWQNTWNALQLQRATRRQSPKQHPDVKKSQ